MNKQGIIQLKDIKEIGGLATKAELVPLATKTELTPLATKAEVAAWASAIPTGLKSAAYRNASDFVLATGENAKYTAKVLRNDCVWVDGYLEIVPPFSVYNKRIFVHEAFLRTSYGDITFDAMVSYTRSPAPVVSGTNAFYLKDRNNQLSIELDFDFVEITYSVVSTTYNDFNYDLRNEIGENVIQNEDAYAGYHSSTGKKTFLAVCPELEERGYRVIESLRDGPFSGGERIYPSFIPYYSEVRKANLYITPYALSGQSQSPYSNPSILMSGAQGDNTFEEKNNGLTRSQTFFPNSVSCGACDDSEVIDPLTGTSYGFNTEFFEDYRTWEDEYPNSAWLAIGFSSTFDSTRKIMTRIAEANSGFLNWRNLKAGDIFRLGTSYTDASKYVEVEIASIDSDTQITFKDAVPELPEGTYIYRNCGPGVLWRPYLFANHPTDTELFPHQQSPVCAVVGAKLKSIKLATGLNWQLIREVARLTAKKTVGGVFGIHPWDKYRGYGIIQVNDAIAWINTNYKSLEYRKELAFRHNLAYGINPVIEYSDLHSNSTISKAHLESVITALETRLAELENK